LRGKKAKLGGKNSLSSPPKRFSPTLRREDCADEAWGEGQSPQASSVEWICLSGNVVLGVGKMKQPMLQLQKLMFKYVITKVKRFKKYTL